MPRPGVANNPSGVNSFDDFAPEQPYGEVTNTKRMAQGAPMAGGKIAAGAINAPKRAGLESKRKPKPPITKPAPPSGGISGPLPPELEGQPPWTWNYPPGTIQNKSKDIWAAIAATPGVDDYPVLKLIAGRAL